MEKVSIKGLRKLRTEAFTKQPFLLCSDRKAIAVITPLGNLSEEEIVTTEKPPQVVKLPKVKQPVLP